MKWSAALALSSAAPGAFALLRFSCSGLVVDRLDPLVNPGVMGTPHIHQIVGGNAFAPTMDPNDDLPKKATCTSCTFTEDFSNYWTQVMYFKHPTNGSFKRVPQDKAHSLGNPRGGMTIYYINGEGFGDASNASKNLTAFRKGFRMLVGDPSVRTMNGSAEAKKLSYRCFDAQRSGGTQGAAPGEGISTGQDTYEFPTKACPGGIRSQVYFPTCWDGTNLDSPDHKSHVAYSVNRKCPTTHPVRIPQVLYETIWDTSSFNSMWPAGTPNPFVWSMNDNTGYGQHADYLFGWEGDALQRAMETCTSFAGTPCNTLKKQTPEQANTCTMSARLKGEDTDGWLAQMPGLGSTAPPVGTNPPQTTQPPNTSQPPPQTTAPPGSGVPKYGQCGGEGYAGPKNCVAGTTCTVSNQWYSQCL